MRALLCLFAILLAPASASEASVEADELCPCLTEAQLEAVDGWSDSFVNADGTKQVTLSGIAYSYPSAYGLATCAAHDASQAPYCDVAAPPEWCQDRWCYVDPSDCKYPAVHSTYFPGVDLRYSYTTCGSKNTFTTWFGENAASTGAHTITDVTDVVSGYLQSIINTIEVNQKEVATMGATCEADSSCPCATCEYDPIWLQAIDVNTATIGLGDGVDPDSEAAKQDVCLALIAADSFTRIAAKEANVSRLGYEYYGSQSIGAYMQWPGLEWCLGDYDPRFRPWYAAAASGPKDVVIVIDSSGSMSAGGRIEMAIDAAKKVVDTLTETDYVNVVNFASDADAYRYGGLVQANSENRELMKAWIDSNVYAVGSTNFRAAFDTAMQQFRASTDDTSGCNRVLLFLTDGQPDEWNDADFANVRGDMEELGAHLLSYALGEGANYETMKRLACENRGIAHKIEDASDDKLANAMASYYTLLSPMLKPCQTRWVGYNDWLTGQYLLGACMAAFETLEGSVATSCEGGLDGLGEAGDKRTPRLLGVGCIDMNLIVDLDTIRARDDWGDFEARVDAERTACPRVTLTALQLETLRANVGAEAICDAEGYEKGELGDAAAAADANIGVIVGGVVGGVVGCVCFVLVCLFCIGKHAKKQKAAGSGGAAGVQVVQGTAVPMGTPAV